MRTGSRCRSSSWMIVSSLQPAAMHFTSPHCPPPPPPPVLTGRVSSLLPY